MPAQYITLEDLCKKINEAGVAVEVEKSVKGRVYGVNIRDIDPKEVVDTLALDEALSVTSNSKKWTITTNKDFEAMCLEERGRFVNALKAAAEPAYKQLFKTATDIYALTETEKAAQMEKLFPGSKMPQSDRAMRLLAEHFLTQQISLGELLLPNLALKTISPMPVSIGQSAKLLSIAGYLAPLAKSADGKIVFPYMTDHSKQGMIAMLAGPKDESLAAKMPRLDPLVVRMAVRWDPEDFRSAFCLSVNVPFQTSEGKAYDRWSRMPLFLGGIDDMRDLKSFNDKDLLSPKRLDAVSKGARSLKTVLTEFLDADPSIHWPRGKALTSDRLLTYAEGRLNILFPVPAFHNTMVAMPENGTFTDLLRRSFSDETLLDDARTNSLLRLGTPRTNPSDGPQAKPQWTAKASTKILFLTHSFEGFDSMAASSVFDANLANTRLNSQPIDLNLLLKAVLDHDWKKESAYLPSNESLSWGRLADWVPFARLASSAQSFRKAIEDAKGKNAVLQLANLQPQEVAILISGFAEIDDCIATTIEQMTPDAVAGHLRNSDPKLFQIELTFSNSKNPTMTLRFDGERIWTAKAILP